jgi:large subunit ribosomal protein L9
MKVIMLQDVKKIGKKGETVVVSDGYGVNYLIPRGLAKASTDSSQKQLARDNAAEEARQKELKAEAEKVKAKLEGLTVEFALNVGSDGRVFGSISTKEIAEGLLKQHGIEIDKRKFIDKTPANALGYTRLKIELYKGSQGQVVGTVNVHVSEQK